MVVDHLFSAVSSLVIDCNGHRTKNWRQRRDAEVGEIVFPREEPSNCLSNTK